MSLEVWLQLTPISLFSTDVFDFRWKRPKTKQCLDRSTKSRRIVCQVTFFRDRHQKKFSSFAVQNVQRNKQTQSRFFDNFITSSGSWSELAKKAKNESGSNAILILEFQHTCCASQLVKSSPKRLQWMDTIQTPICIALELCFMISKRPRALSVSKQTFCAANVFCFDSRNGRAWC